MLFAFMVQTVFVLKPQYALKRHKLIFKGFKVLISFIIHTNVYNACQKFKCQLFYVLHLRSVAIWTTLSIYTKKYIKR